MRKIIIFTFIMILSAASNATEKKINIIWVLAHEPIGLFKEAAEVFSKDVSQKTNGNVEFEILTINEYEQKYNSSKKISYGQFLKKLQSGEIQMSQTYTTDLGKLEKSLYVLDLPFLFRDHAHASKVLEGEIGNNLLASLAKSNLRGLAFTYSGGYRIIPGNKKISRLEDFKGLKIRTSSSPIAQDTFNQLGAKAIPMDLNEIDSAIKSGKIDDAESTYARYFTLGQNESAKIVNETNHSLFLTSIIMNENFWAKLPENYKLIMKDSALKAARLEREHSIQAGIKTKQQCQDQGIQIFSLDQTQQERFKKAMVPIYKKYASMVGPELISKIQNQ